MTVQAIPLLQPPSATVDEIEGRYGAQLALCYQCKKCTAGCPVADAMDIRPHQLVRLARLGAAERLLTSGAIWACVGCYTCTARCPQGVPITEMIYSLKGLALKRGMTPRKAAVPAFLKAFAYMVEHNGRNSELPMMARYFLSTDPREALRQAPMGLKLLLQGRLPLRGEKIRGRKAVRDILRRARDSERKP